MAAPDSGTVETAADQYEHILTVLFEDNQFLRNALNNNNVKTKKALIKLTEDPGKFAAIKWKDGEDGNKEKPLDVELVEELLHLRAFLNFQQNNHGMKTEHPISIMGLTRQQFELYMELTPEEGGGKDLKYTHKVAKESGIANFGSAHNSTLGHQSSSQGSNSSRGNPTGVGGGAAASTGPSTSALTAFEKKQVFSKEKLGILKSKAEWRKFDVSTRGALKLCNMYDLIDPTVTLPTDQDGKDLREKKNILFYMTLSECVTSLEGAPIVKKHSASMDGATVWKELEDLHMTDVSAEGRATHFQHLIHTKVISVPLRRSLVAEIAEFNEWCIEYNAYCKPGEELSDVQRLTCFQRYIEPVPDLESAKTTMDLTEAPGVTKRTPSERIAFYMRKAIQLDDKAKKNAISQRRRVNVSEVALWDECNPYEEPSSTSPLPIEAFMASVMEYYANAAEAGKGRRRGYLPKNVYMGLDPEHRKAWMSIPAEQREIIMTCVTSSAQPASSDSKPRSALRPGIARGARVNQAETDVPLTDPDGTPLVPVDTDEHEPRVGTMSIIHAMKANTRMKKLPPTVSPTPTEPMSHTPALSRFPAHDPGRLMSHLNKSPIQKKRLGVKPEDEIPRVAKAAECHQVTSVTPHVTFPDLLADTSHSTQEKNTVENRIVRMALTTAHTTFSNDLDDLEAGMTIDDPVIIVASALMLGIAGLVDGGANGGLANPQEMRLLYYAEPSRRVNVTGVGDHDIPGLRIGTFAAKVQVSTGSWVLCIFHEYGELKSGKTIHSKIQLGDGQCKVHDDPKKLGGQQCIDTLEGHRIPLDINNGLPYIQMQYPTDDDLKDLPHVVMTRDVPWDPRIYDLNLSRDIPNFDPSADNVPTVPVHENFNQFGEHILVHSGEHRVPSTGEFLPDPDPLYFNFHDGYSPTYHSEIYAHAACLADINIESLYSEQRLAPIEYAAHRRYFLNVPTSTVRHTFDCTTRYYRHIPATNHFMTYRSPYPALNCLRRHELVASDTVFADIVAWGGYEAAQVFVGKLSRYVSVHGCKTDADFVRCLENEIRKRGAMDKLVTDRAKAEISKKVQDILRALFIDDWQSEPYFHHQLFAERIVQELKKFSNWVLNWSDAPAEAWFLVFEYVSFIMNRTAKEGLDWRTPVEALSGQTPDISMLLHFTFWEPVFIKNYEGSGKKFPSESNEIVVRFVGYSEDVGHSCTFKVFNETTQQVLFRSCLRKVDHEIDVINVPPYKPKDVDVNDESVPEVIKIRESDDATIRRTATLTPDELIGRTFLMEPHEDGTRHRAEILDYRKISDAVDEFYNELEGEPARVQFRVKVGGTNMEEYVEWDQMCEFIEQQVMEEDGTWRFRKIVGHKKNLKAREKPQVLIMWESGEITYEPIDVIYEADPYLLAEYAQDHGLIDEWEKKCPRLKLKRHAKNVKKMMRMINQAKLKSYRDSPIYMYGVKVPRNHEQAVKFDEENGDTKWQDAEKLELSQLFEYDCFDDRGHKSTALVPEGYKKIRLHMVYACKHDGRHKARCVAGGHLTDIPTESVYSGVVSLRGIRLIVFLSELNGLKTWCTDIGNAFLECKTSERVYVIAGGEFGDLKDHVFIIVGSLYGLRTSSKRFHERLSDVLREMEFFPCPAEPDIWMRAMNPDGTVMTKDTLGKEKPAFTYSGVSVPIFDGYYEYIATYVDDLTIGSRDPQSIISYLTDVAKFKLKGTGQMEFLLGCDYFRDDNGVLCSAPRKYIKKMRSTYERLFGAPPKERHSPLEPNDHPELDTTSFCDEEDTKIYQSLIGAVQWVVSLGRFDIAVHVMTLGSFRAAPRKGHLERVKRLYGYLCKMKDGIIRYRTDMPDFSDVEFEEHDWSRTVYSGAQEEYPQNLPHARGEPVLMTTYVDANLYHDMLTGKAVTACLHFINMTPFDWYSRKQSTVETATFGSENSAARTAIEQMKANKLTLLYLGIPVVDRSILIGDNKTVVDSAVQPHSKLHKRHLMLSYHYVREAIATGNYAYLWLNGKRNPSDILSKHWGYQAVWPMLQPLLFWQGDTSVTLD